MQSLRILHVAPYFADAWAYGGIPRLAHAMTRGLARRGHHVTVCTTMPAMRQTRLPPRSVSCTPDGVEVRMFSQPLESSGVSLSVFSAAWSGSIRAPLRRDVRRCAPARLP
jgi:hypothetical protein